MLSPTERLRGAVDLLHHEGGVEKLDRDMFGGLLDLRELQVSDVMVHRTEMVLINADLPPEELVREVLATEFTRIPLWRERPENIIGVLHAKDLLRAIRASEGDTAKIDVSTIALPPWFVPEMRPVSEQLKAFRRRKTHFALVVDEYGEVEGMVTLEDILEEIVGDISDEHDVVVAGVRAQPDGSVVVDGSVPIRDLNRAMDWRLPDAEATTVAGLVIHEARSIPERGQSFTFHGFRFRVLRRERNRITALRIVPIPRETEVESEERSRSGPARRFDLRLHQQPLSVVSRHRQRAHRARRTTRNRHRNEMLGAALRGAFDQNLAPSADLRCKTPLQRGFAGCAQSLRALLDDIALHLRHPRRRRARPRRIRKHMQECQAAFIDQLLRSRKHLFALGRKSSNDVRA